MASAPAGTGPPVKMRTVSPGPTVAAERPAGRRFADHAQARAGGLRIGRPHGVAVHRGDRQRRLGQARRDVLRQHAPGGGGERHDLGGQRREPADDPRPGFGHRDHGEPRDQSPERPPDFSSSRMSPMVMPRSIALHMS